MRFDWQKFRPGCRYSKASTRMAHHAAARRGRSRARNAGFTLLELLVVLAIIALIAGLAGPPLVRYLGKAKSDTAKLQVEQLMTSADLFKIDIGRFPTQEEGLEALVRRPSGLAAWNGPYLRKAQALMDPWGMPYQYRNPGQQAEIDIFTLGADRAQGGAGENQDIGNW
jgi:general secretion pathway protein G